MAEHPFILVDRKKRTGESHPRRAPLVLERDLFLGNDGFSLRLAARLRGAVLEADGALHRVRQGRKRSSVLAANEAFNVGRHAYRLTRGEELILDAHRVSELVLFNCFHAVGDETHWRAFRIDDDERALLDWTPAATSVTSFGVSLTRIAMATRRQDARLDAPLARAAVDALVRGAIELQLIQPIHVTITWDGRAHVAATTRDRSHQDDFVRDVAVDTALATVRSLRGDPISAPSVAAFDDLAREPMASAQELATFVRDLFPHAWAIERAVREQAAMLDVRKLSRP